MITTLFLPLVIYVTWMGVGDNLVQIQGCYRIPVVPFLVMPFSGVFVSAQGTIKPRHVLDRITIPMQPLMIAVVASLNLGVAVRACLFRFYNIE